LSTVCRNGDTARAINYALNQWAALKLYVDDGSIEIDNNTAERALRAVALGSKNFLHFGSDGHTYAMSSLESRSIQLIALTSCCRGLLLIKSP
jgi:hypothetical protein